MKNRSLLFGLLLVCALPIWADEPQPELIATIFEYTGENNLNETTPGSPTPYIDKSKFTLAEAGDYMWFNVNASYSDFNIYVGGWEYVNDKIPPYPGCYVLNNVTRGDGSSRKIYITEDMLARIREKDLRVYGNGTLEEITLYKDQVKRDILSNRIERGEKTLWTGYYWMNAWTTLELYPEAFNGIDLSQYKSIRFYHEANRMGYFIKVAKNLESDVIADNGAITHHETYAELELTPDIRTQLTSSWGDTRFNVQMDKQSDSDDDAFNFTDIVLIPNDPVDPCANCFQITLH